MGERDRCGILGFRANLHCVPGCSRVWLLAWFSHQSAGVEVHESILSTVECAARFGGRTGGEEFSCAPVLEEPAMKCLVVIPSFGLKNLGFLRKVLAEFRSMTFETDIVVVSDTMKEIGYDVELRVGLPTKDPRSLPFAHRQIFADRIEQYDLFIYCEDDTLLQHKHIDAFLEATRVLPSEKIAGFLRYEEDHHGNRYCPTIHGRFHWVPESVEIHGGYTFAELTNAHSACYILTKEQLERAIESGGFLVTAHEGRYGMLESAATDPYTQCGMKKVINVSAIDDSCLHHLPNKYLGRLGISFSELDLQVSAILAISRDELTSETLFPPNSLLVNGEWDKIFYDTPSEAVLYLISSGTERVLSVGVASGCTEGELVKRGIQVVGIPMDNIVGKMAESKGIVLLPPDFDKSILLLQGETFDCLLICDVLHHLEEPTHVLRSFIPFVRENGAVIVCAPNFNRFRIWRDLLSLSQTRRELWSIGAFAKSQLHWVSRGRIQKWMTSCLVAPSETLMECHSQNRSVNALPKGLLRRFLTRRIVVLGHVHEAMGSARNHGLASRWRGVVSIDPKQKRD